MEAMEGGEGTEGKEDRKGGGTPIPIEWYHGK